VDITPAEFAPMYGYANRKCGPAAGMHDPLYAKVLVLSAGGGRVAIVTLDLGSIVSSRLREEAPKLNIPVRLLSPSHTHAGPNFRAQPGGTAGATPYRAAGEEKLLSALGEASSPLFPARRGTGQGSLQLGYNRLLQREDGRARALFDNLDRVPYGPVDPEF